MPSFSLSREQRIYLAIWRRAAEKGSLEIKCASPTSARTIRMALYRVIKPYREDPLLDSEMTKIAQDFVVAWSKASMVLNIIPRASTAEQLVDSLLDQLGLEEGDLETPEEKAVVKDFEEFMEAKPKPVSENPFYKRED